MIMMRFLRFSLLLLFLLAAGSVRAQFSIDNVEVNRKSVVYKEKLRNDPCRAEFYSDPLYRAERAAIRKERNYLEIGGGLQGALAAYNDSWVKVSGGDNSIAVVANAYLIHTFTKNKFFIETKVNTKFGYNRMKTEMQRLDADGNPMLDPETGAKLYSHDNVWYKNMDEFAVSIAPSFKMSKNWSYGAIFKFRTQFANTYISRTQQTAQDRKSTFMAPGYLDLSFGITWKSPKEKFPLVVNLSPLATSAIFVESSTIRNNKWDGKFGWEIYGLANADRTSKYEGGSSIQIDFDREFGREKFLRYRTTFYTFFGWITNIGLANKVSRYHDYAAAYDKWVADGSPAGMKPNLPVHPTIRWENTVDIRATKYLSTTFTFLLCYNRAQSLDIQTQTLLSVGLTYTFKNK